MKITDDQIEIEADNSESKLAGKPVHIDKEYTDIVKSETEPDKKFISEDGVSAKIYYYCRECEKMVAPKRTGKKLRFTCSECKSDKVSFGTEESIQNYYKIKVVKGQKNKE